MGRLRLFLWKRKFYNNELSLFVDFFFGNCYFEEKNGKIIDSVDLNVVKVLLILLDENLYVLLNIIVI